jgi:3-oxoacyl-[acyl-carrier-protein] synthase II
LSNVVITGTEVLSVAGLGANRIVDAMTAGLNLFDGNRGDGENSPGGPWPIAKVNPADTAWPTHDPWWINNRKFGNVAAQWAVTMAVAAIAPTGVDKEDERGGVIVAFSSAEEEGVKVIPRLAALSRNDPRPLATILYEEVPDFSYVRGIPSQVGQFIAKATGFRGSNVAVYGESAAGGLSAASLASRLLESEELDRVLVVGVAPPLSPGILASLDRADPLGTEAAPGRGPFDVGRRGTLLGQGSAAIAFERKETAYRRGVEPLADFACCETATASSVAQAVGNVVDLVLTEADHLPAVWWTHGTGSVSLDGMEARAVSPLVKAMTTSAKGTIGTAFECAGLIDIAVAVAALNRGVVPPIGFLRKPDKTLGDIDFVLGFARPAPDAQSALVTSFGYLGGGMTTAGAALIARTGGNR